MMLEAYVASLQFFFLVFVLFVAYTAVKIVVHILADFFHSWNVFDEPEGGNNATL